MRPLFAVGALSKFRAELAAALAGAGVELEVVAPDGPRFNAIRDVGAADLFLLGWNADYPDPDAFARGLLHSETGWAGRFCGSPALDRLLERASRTVDPEARHDLYREIEAVVARDALVLPIFHPRSSRFARPEVTGLEVSVASPFVAYEELRIER
jgi:peptide/nickel transport system substrate-binding protein